MKANLGLTKQSLFGAALAAYAGALVALLSSTLWRVQMGSDARMCPEGSRELTDLCTMGELGLAVFFDFLWATIGSLFALVLTVPCALVLGRLSPALERRFEGNMLAIVQYGLASTVGIGVGYFTQMLVPSIAAACSGVWMFRKVRYANASSAPMVT